MNQAQLSYIGSILMLLGTLSLFSTVVTWVNYRATHWSMRSSTPFVVAISCLVGCAAAGFYVVTALSHLPVMP